MFTGITGHSGALVTAIVVLTGAAILRGGAAAADPNQDDQFLALLNKEDIPAVKNAPSLIATAHRVCLKLDGGMPVDNLVDLMMNNAYNQDPLARLYPPPASHPPLPDSSLRQWRPTAPTIKAR
jgi:hypothetical protein